MADSIMGNSSQIRFATGKSKVFISYSRDDLDFADQLVAALKLCGFDPTLDRHSISGGEAWRQRLGALMLEADTIVFVLSSASVSSDICKWEVEEAVRLGKRILPVLAQPLENTDIPAGLLSLNHIFFYSEDRSPGSGFGAGLTALVAALNTDLTWVREHTRLLERATEWADGGRPAGRLLSGNDIAQAKEWAGRRPKDSPELNSLHLEFIRASEEEDTRRSSAERAQLDDIAAAQAERAKALVTAEEALRHATEAQQARNRARAVIAWGSAAAAVVLAAIAAWAVVQSREAATQEALAKESLFEVQITRSRLLLDAAKKQAQAGDYGAGLLLALEAAPDPKAMLRATDLLVSAQEQLSDSLNSLRERFVLRGHTDRVWGLAITPDGRRVVTGAWGDRPARLWDGTTGTEILEFKGHAVDVNGVAFSADSTRIVTGSDDKTARIWDASTGKELQQLQGHSNFVYGVAFTPDGSRIVTGSADNTARVWDASTGNELLKIEGHTGSVNKVAVTPDGTRIVTGSDDGTARIWDAYTGDELLQLKGHNKGISDVAVTPDGAHILTASGDHVRIWDLNKGNELRQLKGDGRRIWSVAVTSDGSRILAGLHDFVRIWDSLTGDVILDLRGHSDSIRSLAVTLDGATIVTASDDHTARVWSVKRGIDLGTLVGHTDYLWGAALTPDGKRIVTGAAGSRPLRVWDANTTNAESVEFEGADADVNGVAVTPDGTRIVAGSVDKIARVWDLSTGKIVHKLEGHTGIVYGVAVTRDGSRIVTGSADKTARVWDARTGRSLLQLHGLHGHKDEINVVAVTPDSRRIITGSDDKMVRVWDATTGDHLLLLKGHTGAVFGIAVAEDGSRIVTASVDGTARVWDLGTGAHLELKGHTGAVLGVAITPDGALVVTGSADKTIRIWDAKTGAELNQLAGHSGPVSSTVITPDGNQIISSSGDQTARIWDLAGLRPQFSAPKELADRAKQRVPRCLTIQQRLLFALGPEPPSWCLQMAKYPYHADVWRKKGGTDSGIAGDFDDFAAKALTNGDFPKALKASELGIQFDPNALGNWTSKAHAFMFLDRTEEARAIYLLHRDKVVNRVRWEEHITRDFQRFRRRGLTHDLMAEVEKLFAHSTPPR